MSECVIAHEKDASCYKIIFVFFPFTRSFLYFGMVVMHAFQFTFTLQSFIHLMNLWREKKGNTIDSFKWKLYWATSTTNLIPINNVIMLPHLPLIFKATRYFYTLSVAILWSTFDTVFFCVCWAEVWREITQENRIIDTCKNKYFV